MGASSHVSPLRACFHEDSEFSTERISVLLHLTHPLVERITVSNECSNLAAQPFDLVLNHQHTPLSPDRRPSPFKPPIRRGGLVSALTDGPPQAAAPTEQPHLSAHDRYLPHEGCQTGRALLHVGVHVVAGHTPIRNSCEPLRQLSTTAAARARGDGARLRGSRVLTRVPQRSDDPLYVSHSL